MIQFCQALYDDISQNIDEWVTFVNYDEEFSDDVSQCGNNLEQKPRKLKKLIRNRKEHFSDNRCLF